VVDINTPVVNEFALKMIEFDNLVKKVENPLMDLGRARILMRTRFFAGKNLEAAKQLMRGIMERSRMTVAERQNGHVHLEIQQDIQAAIHDVGNGSTYEQRVQDIDPRIFNRVVSVNDDIRRMIARLTIENGAFGVAISANLLAFVKEAVEGSSYAGIINETMGSRLKFQRPEDRIFHPTFEGEALHGQPKVDALRALSLETGKTLRVALGDSIKGDGPMGIEAVRNGGVFVVTGQSFEAIQKQFRKLPEQARTKGVNNMAQRTWALSY